MVAQVSAMRCTQTFKLGEDLRKWHSVFDARLVWFPEFVKITSPAARNSLYLDQPVTNGDIIRHILVHELAHSYAYLTLTSVQHAAIVH